MGAITKANMSSNVIDYTLYGKALEGLSARQVSLALSTKNLSATELEEIVGVNHLIEKYGAEELIKVGLLSANSSLLASEKVLNAERVKEDLLLAGIKEDQAEILISKHLSAVADDQESVAKQVLIKELMDEAVAKELITAENAKEYLSSKGVIASDVAEKASKEGLTSATLKLTQAQLAAAASNPLTWITVAIGGAFLLAKGIDILTESTEEAGQAATEAKEKYDEIESNIESLNNKIEENKKLIAETNGSPQYEGYRKRLEAENKELERQIYLEEIKAQKARSESDKKATKALTSQTYEYDVKYTVNGAGAGYTKTSTKGDIATATDWYLDQAEETGVVSDNLENNINTIKEQRENLDLSNSESQALYDRLGLLIDRYIALYPEIKVVSDEINGSSESTDKATASLETLTESSHSVSALATAFKELTDNEYISFETISKIKEAVGDSISNWDEYEQKLLSVKKGTAEYNQLMSELTYATLEKQIGGVNALAKADEKRVAQILKENGVLNANKVAQEMVNRANAEAKIASSDLSNASEDTIISLVNEGVQCGVTQSQMYDLIASEIRFSNNNLDVSQKVNALNQVAIAAMGADKALSVISNKSSWEQKQSWASSNNVDVIANKGKWTENGVSYTDAAYRYNGVLYDDIRETYLAVEHDRIKNSLGNIDFTTPDYSGNSPKDTKESFNWIETSLSRVQRAITNLGKKVSATYKSWTSRNHALGDEIAAVNKEITLQQDALSAYKKKADNVNLGPAIKEKVREGSISIEEYSGATVELIQEYQEWYEKSLACEDALQDLNDQLATLAKTKFDNVANEFDNLLSSIEHDTSMLDAYITLAETSGHMVSAQYYDSLIATEKENLSTLENKYSSLTTELNKAMSTGKIELYSEEWYNMMSVINSVEQAMME